ncbi:hypothetical protein M885DRAFT_511387 [Pelagophyceae sp. CCMP2097]|nr:hypothetical protein M885DRAFT_511387 [Pelagophyceae sp. CCMP2097]
MLLPRLVAAALVCASAALRDPTRSRGSPIQFDSSRGRDRSADDGLDDDLSWHKRMADLLPHLDVRVSPLTSLKIRKHFHILSTVLSFGADYSTNDGVWAVKTSWEDSIIGGKLVIKGSELQLHKNWIFSMGANLAANLRLKGVIDLATGKMSGRFGFRTEHNASPLNIVDGIELIKKLPLDGHDGHAKLELKLRVAFPQPEVRAERLPGAHDSGAEPAVAHEQLYVGMGDLQIDLDELNLCLDW